jgi:hypothetical protein
MLITIFSCGNKNLMSTTKTIEKSDKKNDTIINSKMKLSLYTKQFIREIKSMNNNKKIDEKKLSDEFIKKHGIIKRNNHFFIGGFVKINESFDSQDLKNMNIKINSKSGNIITLEIPINSLNALLKYEGINYFEINQKVELKNK